MKRLQFNVRFGVLGLALGVLFSTFFFARQVIAAVATPDLSYDESTHQVSFSVASPAGVEYELIYLREDTNTQEALTGTAIANNGEAAASVYVGTCSSTDCLPHPFSEGEFRTTQWSDGSQQAVSFVVKNGKIITGKLTETVVSTAAPTTTAQSSNPSLNLDQCANGGVGAPPEQCADNQWENGNLNQSKAHYVEGDTVAYRTIVKDLQVGETYTVKIQWDTTKQGKHAIDYLTTYNRTETDADPCGDVLTAAQCASPSTAAIPADLFMQADPNWNGAQIAGNFTMFNGTITGVSSYEQTGTFSGDASAALTLTFTATANGDAVISWGGHIATRADWGVDNSAVAIPGSPYHMRLIGFTCTNPSNCSVGNQDRSLSAGAVFYPAQLTIVKEASPESDQVFNFGGTLGAFTLTDDGTAANTTTFTQLDDPNVTYLVNEVEPTNWNLTNIQCSGAAQAPAINISNAQVGITIAEAESITCTFYNTFTGVPGLSVTKTDDNQSVNVGDSVTYHLAYENTGDTPLTNVFLQETVPAGTSFTQTAGWECSLLSTIYQDGDVVPAGATCNYQLGSLAVGQQGSVDFTVTVLDPSTLTQVENTVFLNSDQTTPDSDDETTPVMQPTPSPTPLPSPTPEPTATPEPSPSPEVTPEPSPEVTPTPEPTVEPTPSPEVTPTPSIEPSPSASPSASPTASPSASPQPGTAFLTLAKWNNVFPVNQTPGDVVTYTLQVTAAEGDVNNVTVIDLPPDNFGYVKGSWTAFSSVRGDLRAAGITTEPTYASPGTWTAEDMVEGEVVTLTYQALIGDSADPGVYPDVAFAQGEPEVGGTMLALAEPTGFIATNYVGTQVSLVNETTSTPTQTVIRTEDREVTRRVSSTGKVLGASTMLPETGANKVWSNLGLLAMMTGLMTMIAAAGHTVSGQNWLRHRLQRSRTLAKATVVAAVLALLVLLPTQTFAQVNGTLSLRVEDSADYISGSSFRLDYVALDIANRNVTVYCYLQRPGEAGFTMNQQAVLKTGGDSDACTVNNLSNGSHQIYVVAEAGLDTVTSATQTIQVNTKGPSTPVSYSKKSTGTCDYLISFTTANDGVTSEVEVYRSESTTFNADSGTRVAEVSVGPNQTASIQNTRPDCGKEYYYAVRAFDAAGNGSGVIGDEKIQVNEKVTEINDGSTDTTTQTTGATTSRPRANTGAIPVANAQVSDADEAAAESEVLGEQTAVDTTPSLPATTDDDSEGQVLGASDTAASSLAKPMQFALVLGLLFAMILGGYAVWRARSPRSHPAA